MARNDDRHGDYYAKHKRKDMSRSKPSDMVSPKSVSTSDRYSKYDGSSNHIRNIEIPAELMRSRIGRFFFKSVVDKLEDRIEQRVEELEAQSTPEYDNSYESNVDNEYESDELKKPEKRQPYGRTKFSGVIDFVYYGFSLYIAFAWFLPMFEESMRGSSAMGLGPIVALICIFAGFLVLMPIRLKFAKWIG